MSATNRGAQRIDQDAYQTPLWCVDLIIEEIMWDRVVSFLEPCKGDGNILQPISKLVKFCWDAEIKEGRDYFALTFPKVDLIVTNPPFSLAQEFLAKSLKGAETIVYLLRLNFLGSQRRKSFWQKNPPTHLFVLSKRPQFVDVCKSIKYEDAARIEHTEKGCGFACRPGEYRICPNCEHPVGPGTDATEYAWFVWDWGELFRRSPGIYVI